MHERPNAVIRQHEVMAAPMRAARRLRVLALAIVLGAGAVGCGFAVQPADLFLLSRQGPGGRLTLLVGDGGTIRCDGGGARTLSDALLIQARDLADDLDKDAKANLHLPAGPGSVYTFSVRLQDGAISFPDTAAARHRELAQAELFAVQAAQRACGLAG